MSEIMRITQNENQEPIVSGRELHHFLENKEPYTKWFDRMKEYGFVENVDFSVFYNFVKDDTAFGGTRKKIDHAIKIDMAKELSMIQRTERGKKARQYFIQVEKDFNSPEKIMARALMIADRKIRDLSATIESQKSKVLFAESVETSKDSILIGQLAKLISQNGFPIGQNRLFDYLRSNGYLIKQKGENYNLPSQYSMDLGLMEVKKRTVDNPDGSIRTTTTTKVTGKGQIYFINRFLRREES